MENAKNILLVEDEKITAMAETRDLQRCGYSVFAVPSGEMAIEEIRKNHYDLILMDIDLGKGMNGTEAAKLILSEKEIPLIFLSSHNDPAIVELTERITSYGYVVKQSGITVLDASIKMAFRLYMEKIRANEHQAEAAAINEELHAALEELEAGNEELIATNEQLNEKQKELLAGERALIESERRYRTLYESMIEGVCLHEIIYDSDGRAVDYKIIDTNPRYEEILNLKNDDVTGRPASEIYNTFPPPFLDIYARVAETGEPEKFDTWFPPMKKHFLISTFSPARGQFATVFEDITERKNMETSLRQSEEKYRTYIENAPEGVFIADEKGNYIDVNPAACNMTGYQREELLTMSIRDLASPEMKMDSSFENLKKFGKTTTEVILRKKDGTDIISSLSATALEENRYMAFCSDITEKKTAEKRIEELLNEKNMLLREVHHRIKNDMNTILSLIVLQAEQCENEEAKKILNEAENRIVLMGHIYNTLYQSKSLTSIEIKSFLEDLIEDLQKAYLQDRGIRIVTEISPVEISPRDSFPLGIIVNELINNAFKYAFDSTGSGEIRLAVSKMESDILEIIVTDNGTGISKEIIEKKDFGFGLMLVENLSDHYKGDFEIISEGGTTVRLNLKIEPPTQNH